MSSGENAPPASVKLSALQYSVSWQVTTPATRPHLFQFSLRSRCTAMLAGLRTLIQTWHGPDR